MAMSVGSKRCEVTCLKTFQQNQQVDIGYKGPGDVIKANLPYATEPSDGIGVVGNPRKRTGWTQQQANDASAYVGAGDFPLNSYVVPNWRVGNDFETSRCPSDRDTVKAPKDTGAMGYENEGAIGDCWEVLGTSYGTNIENRLNWRGHGAWAMPVERAENHKVGPNFNPEKIYLPSRYMVMIDLCSIFENWELWIKDVLGTKNGIARWHESSARDPWNQANGLFADSHVSFRTYVIPEDRITLADIGNYVNAEWALYPLRYVPKKGGGGGGGD